GRTPRNLSSLACPKCNGTTRNNVLQPLSPSAKRTRNACGDCKQWSYKSIGKRGVSRVIEMHSVRSLLQHLPCLQKKRRTQLSHSHCETYWVYSRAQH